MPPLSALRDVHPNAPGDPKPDTNRTNTTDKLDKPDKAKKGQAKQSPAKNGNDALTLTDGLFSRITLLEKKLERASNRITTLTTRRGIPCPNGPTCRFLLNGTCDYWHLLFKEECKPCDASVEA